MGVADDEWSELAVRAQAGDRRAYERLLREAGRFVRAVLVPGLANPDWADDIAQDVLLSVHKSLHTYTPGLPFKPWLMAIVQFRRADYLRKHYRTRRDRETHTEDRDFLAAHVTEPAHAGEAKDIEAALQALPEKQRNVVIMTRIQGYKIEEAAAATGMSVSAVKVSVHRALKRLKESLG